MGLADPRLWFGDGIVCGARGHDLDEGVRDSRRVHELEGQLALAQTRSLQIARAADETDKLLGTPGTVRVALTPMPGMPAGRAGVLYNAKMGMVACAGWLPAAPAGKRAPAVAGADERQADAAARIRRRVERGDQPCT